LPEITISLWNKAQLSAAGIFLEKKLKRKLPMNLKITNAKAKSYRIRTLQI